MAGSILIWARFDHKGGRERERENRDRLAVPTHTHTLNNRQDFADGSEDRSDPFIHVLWLGLLSASLGGISYSHTITCILLKCVCRVCR